MTAQNGRDPGRRRTTRPYRDSALAYAGLGALVAIVAFATGSSALKSVGGGIAGFVLATAYTWWRLRARERAAERSP